jgi:Lactoylglutathione lyase and related lyases
MVDNTDATSVTADQPDSPIQTTGTDHITIWGSNETDTIEFYQELLGMPLVLRQPNLDDPSQTHLFFDTGDGRILTVFVGDRQSTQQQRGGIGAVHHLCFSVAPSDFEDVMAALEADGRGYNVFDRGVFFSLYTQDNNGLIIELSTDKYDIPAERRGRCLQRHRNFGWLMMQIMQKINILQPRLKHSILMHTHMTFLTRPQVLAASTEIYSNINNISILYLNKNLNCIPFVHRLISLRY